MKKLLFILAMLLGSSCYAQSFIREGKVLVSNTASRTSTKDTLVTDIQWKDSKSNYYPIILNKSNGRCYIWKVSSKTGRHYKMYLKEDASKEVCKEYDITYIEKSKWYYITTRTSRIFHFCPFSYWEACHNSICFYSHVYLCGIFLGFSSYQSLEIC